MSPAQINSMDKTAQEIYIKIFGCDLYGDLSDDYQVWKEHDMAERKCNAMGYKIQWFKDTDGIERRQIVKKGE